MTVKFRLSLLVVLLIAGLLLMLSLQQHAIEQVEQLGLAETEVSQLQTTMLLLRRHEKDFLARNDLKYVDKFAVDAKGFAERLAKLKARLIHLGIESADVEHLAAVISSYELSFSEVVSLKQDIGLTHEEGLRGSLRKAVHDAESLVKALNDDTALAGILQLRRNEKDFLLRLDLKYQTSFQKNMSVLQTYIDNSDLAADRISALRASLSIYQSDFFQLIDRYQALGLSSSEGLMGEMRNTVHQSETILDELFTVLTGRLMSDSQSIKTTIITVVITIALFLALFAVYITRSILQPLSALTHVMAQAREHKDLTIVYEGGHKDEIAQMGDNFNSMMQAFKALMHKVGLSSISLGSASEEVSAIAIDTKHGLENQTNEVLEISSAIGEMELAMREISKNTDLTAQTAQTSQDNAADSQRVIVTTIKNINALASEAEETSVAVQRLEDNSHQIGSVLDVIKGIAGQTNLLALNAAIEAARAGDSGRGFAVVADEVRGLAGRTQESAIEIEAMISDLQSQTSVVATMMQRSVSLSRGSAEEASGSIESLERIMQGANHIVDMTAQVASAVEEQTSVASIITKNAERIRQILDESNENVAQNAAASEEVAKQAVVLKTLIAQFRVD